jgi:hypothetical protein
MSPDESHQGDRPDDGAASISETSVNFYQTTWRNNPEDSHLHTHRRENFKSQLKKCFVTMIHRDCCFSSTKTLKQFASKLEINE